ncbi:hypothetical protein B0H14DRAFT_2599098 [Mycena olivaceomarginata]|nr:hypothetical protein B0H14DRAFT_2599098 [Mycena olivaceomarginata]
MRSKVITVVFSTAGQAARMTEIRDDNSAVVGRGGRLGRRGLAAPAATDGGSTRQTLLGRPCRVSSAASADQGPECNRYHNAFDSWSPSGVTDFDGSEKIRGTASGVYEGRLGQRLNRGRRCGWVMKLRRSEIQSNHATSGRVRCFAATFSSFFAVCECFSAQRKVRNRGVALVFAFKGDGEYKSGMLLASARTSSDGLAGVTDGFAGMTEVEVRWRLSTRDGTGGPWETPARASLQRETPRLEPTERNDTPRASSKLPAATEKAREKRRGNRTQNETLDESGLKSSGFPRQSQSWRIFHSRSTYSRSPPPVRLASYSPDPGKWCHSPKSRLTEGPVIFCDEDELQMLDMANGIQDPLKCVLTNGIDPQTEMSYLHPRHCNEQSFPVQMGEPWHHCNQVPKPLGGMGVSSVHSHGKTLEFHRGDRGNEGQDE